MRIKGGAARAYYVAVASPLPSAEPLGLCVLPYGAEEGERHVARSKPLALRVGQPARFELYASLGRSRHVPGELIALDDENFVRVAPVVTNLALASNSGATEVPVLLEGELSAVGTVELACIEAAAAGEPAARFRLAFAVREDAALTADSQPGTQSVAQKRLQQALEAMERVFGKGRKDVKARESKDLIRELERLLGERRGWSVELNRTLFDALAPKAAARRRSPDHERVFWMLCGYCLRPGIGHPSDPARIALLAPLFDEALSFADETRNFQQFWIAWRRVAAGLGEEQQSAMRATLDPLLAPDELKLKKPKAFRAHAFDELLEFASFLERVPRDARARLGGWLFERTWTRRDPRLWAALGRIGARVPAYASVHYVLGPKTVERWLDALLRDKWHDLPSAPEAARKLARVTLDRARDVSEALRLELLRRLEQHGAPEDFMRPIREFVPVADSERATWFEDLPVGLRILEDVVQ